MDLQGEYRIPALRERVWAALNDPALLAAAIPGCEEIGKESDTAFVAKVVAKFGPVKATFTGRVTLSDLDPPSGYTISGEGQGGVAGFAKGEARVTLTADGAETVLRYEAKGDVGGKLAQIGSRLIGGTAQKLADDFFGKFVELVSAQAPVETPTAGPAEAPAPPPPVAAPTAKALAPWVWVLGVVVVVAILLGLVASL